VKNSEWLNGRASKTKDDTRECETLEDRFLNGRKQSSMRQKTRSNIISEEGTASCSVINKKDHGLGVQPSGEKKASKAGSQMRMTRAERERPNT